MHYAIFSQPDDAPSIVIFKSYKSNNENNKNHIYLNRTTDRILQPKEKINIFEKREYWIAGPFIFIREG